ncbi:30S ribosome-binding factor RbfA [Paraferrimonas sp. SM1919]|uniref:30S ribosome-binding factor RbfA n=1 Tax=Paraferrimonas sp. SM1919 TaxID=2662263 RepID=UPI0013D2E454|nr:30S ribosome-binding factor RbfA [Paraferrimonas sp. SM1919]
MAKEFSRTQRVGQQMQKELALIIQREIKDPRLGMVTVNSVEVSRDLSYAKVYVTFFDENPERIEEQVSALKKASGYVRKLIASRIKMRVVPELRFVYDQSLINGIHMANMVTNAIKEDEKRQQKFGSNEAAAQEEE